MVHARTLWGDGERWTARALRNNQPLSQIAGPSGRGKGAFGPRPPEGRCYRPNAGGCCPMGVAARSGSLHRGIHINPQPLSARIDCGCDFCGGIAPGVSAFAVLASPDVLPKSITSDRKNGRGARNIAPPPAPKGRIASPGCGLSVDCRGGRGKGVVPAKSSRPRSYLSKFRSKKCHCNSVKWPPASPRCSKFAYRRSNRFRRSRAFQRWSRRGLKPRRCKDRHRFRPTRAH